MEILSFMPIKLIDTFLYVFLGQHFEVISD